MKKNKGIIKYLLIFIAITMLVLSLWKYSSFSIQFKTMLPIAVVKEKLLIWAENQGYSIMHPPDAMGGDMQKGSFAIQTNNYTIKTTLHHLNDSINRGVFSIKNTSWINVENIFIPIYQTQVEQWGEAHILPFVYQLRAWEKKLKINIMGIHELGFTKSICYQQNIDLKHKKDSMMHAYSIVDNFFASSKIKLEIAPYLKVIEWDKKEDRVKYNFCFPYKAQNISNLANGLFQDSLASSKMLYAQFNGNYKDSHIAWASLWEYAKKNKIDIHLKPIEFFINNPHLSSDEMSWLTKVYLPLK